LESGVTAAASAVSTFSAMAEISVKMAE